MTTTTDTDTATDTATAIDTARLEQLLGATITRGLDRLETVMRSGHGIGYSEQDHNVIHGIAEVFRAAYNAYLLDDWIPALEGVPERLSAGARVADVGCGYGVTTILMAQRFPASTFHGFDYDTGSIERARAAAAEAGVADRVHFEVCDATEFPALGYDLICTFDALHDYGRPVAAARRVRECLVPGSSWMIVEPQSGDTVEENLNPSAGCTTPPPPTCAFRTRSPRRATRSAPRRADGPCALCCPRRASATYAPPPEPRSTWSCKPGCDRKPGVTGNDEGPVVVMTTGPSSHMGIDCGDGGNRTRVQRCRTRASPCAVRCAFLGPGDHANKSPTGPVTV